MVPAERLSDRELTAIYEYPATLLRAIDGDTVECDIDLGFKIRQRMTCRLDGIDAPELHTPEGAAARDALALLVGGKTLGVRTIRDKREKFGRILLVIYLEDGVTTANQWLLDHGYAVPYGGGKR